MTSIARQIAAVKAKKSPEQLAMVARDAERRGRSFGAQLATQRDPGTGMDAGFLGQLRATAKQARSGLPPRQRTDVGALTLQMRAQGILATPDDPNKVGYVPTPEEILGEDAAPASPSVLPPQDADPHCPPADRVLEAGKYVEGALSLEEIAEIDRLNPRQSAKASAPPKAMKGARPLRNPVR